MLKLILLLIVGIILSTAFSPFNIYSFAFICPAVLCYCWLTATPRRAFIQGLMFGIGFFAAGTSWIYISIHDYGGASTLASGMITVGFVLYQALFPAIQGYLIKKLFNHRRISEAGFAFCLFPASWVLFEWLRGHLLTGFPWLLLGYSQLATPVKHLAPIVGVFGLSLITAMMAGALSIMGRRLSMKTKWIGVAIIVLPVAIGFTLRHHEWTQPIQSPIQVSLLQGNIPQQLKWQTGHQSSIINRYKTLTEAHWDSGLIIWPEAAIPTFPSQVRPLLETLDQAGKQHHTQLMIGIPLANYQTGQLYNGLIVLGQYQGRYLKRHLVPFGEYTPLKSIIGPINRWLNIPMSDFSAGPSWQPLLKIANRNTFFYIAPFICYEIAYPLEVIDSVLGHGKHDANQLPHTPPHTRTRTSITTTNTMTSNTTTASTMKEQHNISNNTTQRNTTANVLVTLLDDSWFGRSIASAQHLQIGQMRALETQRPMLMASNNGITASINATGAIVSVLKPFQVGVLTTQVQPRAGKTPFMILKNWPMWAGVLALVLIAVCFCFRRDHEQRH